TGFDTNIDRIWDIISEAIRYAANKNIPRKKVTNDTFYMKCKRKTSALHKSIVALSKIIQSVKKVLDTRTALVRVNDTNKAIDKINAEQGTNIEQIRHVDETVLTEWVQVAKHGLKAMRLQERLKDDKQ
ncbi:1546_t:CDS:1, partial [Dentiscutata heterogama]